MPRARVKKGPCPECHHPVRNRDVRKRVTLPGRRVVLVCYYCASGYENFVARAVVESLPR